MVLYACNSQRSGCIPSVESGGLEVQGHLELHGDLEASLNYMKPRLNPPPPTFNNKTSNSSHSPLLNWGWGTTVADASSKARLNLKSGW